MVTRLLEGFQVSVEEAEHAFHFAGTVAQLCGEPTAQRGDVRLLHRSETAVTGAAAGRTQRAAAGLRDRAQTGLAAADQHARHAPPLALDAQAVRGDVRLPAGQQRRNQLQQLVLVHRAAAQLEVDEHVGRDRRGRFQRADKLRAGVDIAGELVDVGPVAQGLNSARGRTGANGDQVFAVPAHALDALLFVGRGDAPFDQADVVRRRQLAAAGFEKIGDLDGPHQVQQLVFQVEELQLAAVTTGELENRQFRLAGSVRFQNFLHRHD